MRGIVLILVAAAAISLLEAQTPAGAAVSGVPWRGGIMVGRPPAEATHVSYQYRVSAGRDEILGWRVGIPSTVFPRLTFAEAVVKSDSLGLAYIDYSGSQVAGIAEVSLDRASGQIKVHNFWCTIDCGVAVQPDNVVAQTESSIVYGLGMTLTERITIKDGAVQESNFYDYRVPRMNEVPEMHIELIQTDNHPTGAGQMATPLVAPAISNAIARLTGVRLRETPMTPERVRKALG